MMPAVISKLQMLFVIHMVAAKSIFTVEVINAGCSCCKL